MLESRVFIEESEEENWLSLKQHIRSISLARRKFSKTQMKLNCLRLHYQVPARMDTYVKLGPGTRKRRETCK